MPRPRHHVALSETHRECRGCKQVLELNVKNFAAHASSKNGFRRRCRECLRQDNRLGEKLRQTALAKVKAEPKWDPSKHCPKCEGLSHRRPLSGCPCCQLPYQPEAPIEPVLRKFDWAV